MENYISGFKINELDQQHHGDEIKHNASEKKANFVMSCAVHYLHKCKVYILFTDIIYAFNRSNKTH